MTNAKLKLDQLKVHSFLTRQPNPKEVRGGLGQISFLDCTRNFFECGSEMTDGQGACQGTWAC